MNLRGSKIIVTGGSRGIGAGIVRELANQGAQVAFTYSSNKESAESILENLSGEHLIVPMNMQDTSSIETGISTILQKFGNIDGLVNNAGITKDQLILRMNPEDFDSVYQVNLKGTFYCTKLCLKPMLKARKGSIVHISSVVGHTGNPGQSNYTAMKAGIEGFSKSIALELSSRNIRSNCVAPGFIESDMTAALSEDQKKQLLEKIPLGRIGTVADVSNCVAFLLSDKSSYMTGQTLHVNGGMFLN